MKSHSRRARGRHWFKWEEYQEIDTQCTTRATDQVLEFYCRPWLLNSELSSRKPRGQNVCLIHCGMCSILSKACFIFKSTLCDNCLRKQSLIFNSEKKTHPGLKSNSKDTMMKANISVSSIFHLLAIDCGQVSRSCFAIILSVIEIFGGTDEGVALWSMGKTTLGKHKW